MAIAALKWEEYIALHNATLAPEDLEKMTAADYLRFYLDSFLDLYRNHSDTLRFNYNFNSFLRHEASTAEQKQPYMQVVDASMSTIELGRDVVSIGANAFYCAGLTSLTTPVGSRLSTIQNAAFSACNNLTTVVLPATVSTIGNGAFFACRNMSSATFQWAEAGTVLHVGEKAFRFCKAPFTVTLDYTGVTQTDGKTLRRFTLTGELEGGELNSDGKTATITLPSTEDSPAFTATPTFLAEQSVSFAVDTKRVTYGDEAFTVAAVHTTGDGAVSYVSSDPTVATVNAASGEITVLKTGRTTITATAGETAEYAAASASYTLEVKPKAVSITGLAAEDKVYDGTSDATVTGTAVIAGKVSGDDLTVSAGTASFADKNAGTGKTVTFSGFGITGEAAGNYTLSAQPASVTANITKAPMTVTAKPQTITYGDAPVNDGVTCSGFVSGRRRAFSAARWIMVTATPGMATWAATPSRPRV